MTPVTLAIQCMKCSGAGLYSYPQQAYAHAPDCPNLLAEIESRRQSRHHDVLCLVIKESFRAVCARNTQVTPKDVAECVKGGQIAADLAYPPPKAEP